MLNRTALTVFYCDHIQALWMVTGRANLTEKDKQIALEHAWTLHRTHRGKPTPGGFLEGAKGTKNTDFLWDREE
jgi:hypothetical protein